MESPDFKGIETMLEEDSLLRREHDEYKKLKKQIAKLEKKPFLTADEEREERLLKKMKLQKKEIIMNRMKERRKNG